MNAGSRDFDSALSAVMGDLAREVDALHACLIDERMALDQANSDALQTITRSKGSLLDRIDRLDSERRQLGAAGNIDSANDPRWAPTFSRIGECRQINETNGRIVSQRIGHVRQALALISGDSTGGAAATYGPRGSTQVRLRSGILAQV
ncbi:flagellar protein FlgN [Luteibacter pinisoli]|jgi:flagella synthesis protein FlgN|uniref:Flagellar protein FlgN n=1 Tax=Luteibacter pinisoli TaxID=2589080 RepID=A0A4Y5Z553_9GAMM|nr:flagellar protein FlgN [Luteibacter pinisoli]QDE40570.1 flagellar protein FlgN [Luteibacter pinisoli]